MSDAEDQSLLEDEGAGYLVSVSDIMAGLLFVFIITLVAFVIQFQYVSDATDLERQEAARQRQAAEREKRELTQTVNDLTNSRELRRALLSEIKNTLLEKEGLRVEVDLEQGILRLTEETVRFRTAQYLLDEIPKRNVTIIARVLNEILPCYAGRPPLDAQCKPETQGKLEAVFIEGHTDNEPIRGVGYSNWELSSQRAISTYNHMREIQPELGKLTNSRDELLFSVAGYADSRPQFPHQTPTDDERNRRIDMRFIMTPPSKNVIVEEMKKRDVR